MSYLRASVSCFRRVSYISFLADNSDIEDPIDGSRSRSEQRRPRGTIRSNRMVFCATRNLYERVSNHGNDGHHDADPGRGA